MPVYEPMFSETKKKQIALPCCILGGWFGLHYFYVGRVKKGILYTCTFGLFAIGWIVDIIRVVKNDFPDKYGCAIID